MKKPITKKRAREICLAAAEFLEGRLREFACNALREVCERGEATEAEVDELKLALFRVYAPHHYENGCTRCVIWTTATELDEGLRPEDEIYREAKEARIIALLLLPEFV